MTSREPLARAEAIELPTVRISLFDPAPDLGWLREHRPLCRLRYPDGQVGWLVTNYALAKAVLTDARFGMRLSHMPVGDPQFWSAIFDAFDKTGISAANVGDLDPPEHTRYRRLLAAPFGRRGVENYRERIQRVVADALDAMQQAGPPVDLVTTFATPIAGSTQCMTLGAPETDSDRFLRFHAVAFDPTASIEDVQKAFANFGDYLRPMIEQKRLEPGDDVMSYVVGHDELNDQEIFSLISQLFIAGHATTAGMLALAVFTLLCHPDQLEALRADPSLTDMAVEELLRYVTIFQASAHTRTALEDVELNGITIKEGESVTVSLAAANRDPDKFDHPDTLDLQRSETGHLGFGQGAHMCLGQHLARVELQIGVAELLKRFPTLRLAIPIEEVRTYGGDQFNYGVQELPVAW